MSTFYTLLTALGSGALTNAYAGGTTINLTHLAVGDGNGAFVTPVEGMTTLVHERHRVPISALAADATNPNWLIAEAVIPSAVGGFTVREVGLFDAGNKLIAVGNFPETYKPTLAEGSGRDLLIRMIIETSNAAQVTLTIDPSVVLATNASIANAVLAHEVKPDPHPQYIKTSQRGAINGVAPLVNNLVPMENLPPAIASDAELAASLYAHVDPLTDPHPQYITADDLSVALLDSRARRHYFANL